MEDKQILELILKRDEAGIKEIEQRYGARLRLIAEGLLSKEDAEECLNDAYLILWNHAPEVKPQHLFAYLVMILKNLARQRWRDAKARKRDAVTVELSEQLAETLADFGTDTEGEAILNASDCINRFLKKQEKKNRVMFVLRYWYGKEIREIADYVGISSAAAAKALNRMKRKLIDAVRKGEI